MIETFPKGEVSKAESMARHEVVKIGKRKLAWGQYLWRTEPRSKQKQHTSPQQKPARNISQFMGLLLAPKSQQRVEPQRRRWVAKDKVLGSRKGCL